MMAVYYVYIIRCTGKRGKVSHYTGYTNDLVRRFDEHRCGKGARFLAGKKELFVVYFETFSKQGDAMRREIEIKRDHGLKHELIDNNTVHECWRCTTTFVGVPGKHLGKGCYCRKCDYEMNVPPSEEW